MPTNSVTMTDKAVASAIKEQQARTISLFRARFGKPISYVRSGMLGERAEWVLPEGQDFTPAERAWLDVFSEGYTTAIQAVMVWQVNNTKRRY